MFDDPPHLCEVMAAALSDQSIPLVYSDQYREYAILILDGGGSFLQVNWCPFCGADLPESLRDEWFDRLEALGLDPGEGDVPLHFLTGAWWRNEPSGA